MQDGFIFSDTIERNIAAGDENIDCEKLHRSVQIANLEGFVKNLPRLQRRSNNGTRHT
jgi:ATP-binding cassette subfamily B protein